MISIAEVGVVDEIEVRDSSITHHYGGVRSVEGARVVCQLVGYACGAPSPGRQ